MKKWTKLLGLALSLAAAAGFPAAGSGGAAAAADTAAAVASIAAYGPDHLIKKDGSLWVWGDSRSVPTRVPGLAEVKASFGLAGGGGLAVKQDLSVWQWQTNTKTLAMETAQVPEMTGLTDLALVQGTYLAVSGAGAVYQATLPDDGTSRVSFSPVGGIEGVTAAGGYFEDNEQGSWKRFLFLKQDGTVWTSTDQLTSFQPVRKLSQIIQLESNFALAGDGTVWTWPVESIYNPVAGSDVMNPVPVTGLKDIRILRDNGRSTLAIDNSANLWFRGMTITGSSDGTTFHEQTVPLRFTGIRNVTDAYIMERSIVALTADGKVYTTSIGEETITADAVFTLLASNITSIKGGGRHIIMQKSDGTLWGWGVNKNAQLGYANYDFSFDQPVPMQKPIAVTLNGEPVNLTNGVITRGGQNFVPLRSLFDKLGAIVAYKENHTTTPTNNGGTASKVDKIVTITRTAVNKASLSISINTVSGETTVNGTSVTLATPPFIVNGTIYLPLRFISEQLGATVNWLPLQEEIAISMK
ncbi:MULTISPECIES: stalk domain-containing protein [unclassified Paenibacillus]|uniref:stalk domain-containing protein n=1 Tax=unclassified Paenibacillus TaxID=185978 RepID=UPI0024056B6C|nr:MULTISPECIES: stalk domain-containing protein [unclassified Paenibacillus]MDF9842265.1 alpha-tubulin suppressor-like RCC1 family protein [Paenibacillus sp. PastF-2]MDF9848858.1 alpha-tubulin suppressor-like RCC1 family protein [Paenibacillus sp. PastM-2]MDF9855428.1 alpha-tubulin suppressor-like RCC1 family protein [Paenibacillus sp. PastF-1]MDH6480696.1 alpha-tubulin suppressor-like RCC1 family protein [Paenibacillus sp. PastH-2]MDH6508123.1 alpha-tubulin suppressor-like RCC1 family protei